MVPSNPGTQLANGAKILGPGNVDFWYGPYDTVEECVGFVLPEENRPYRTVNVAGVEMWWLPGDTSNTGLVVKNAGAAGLPSQTGQAGKVLGTDGTSASWVPQASGLPVQSGATAGKVLKSDGTSASWQDDATGGAGVALEQDLSSNSTTAAPSVAAVRGTTGLLSNLLTTVKTSLVGGINELVGGINELVGLVTSLRSDIGTLASLTTSAKGSLVAAVNETRSVLAGSTAQTGAYTLALADAGNVVPINSSSAVQVTVPADATTNFPVGTCMEISQEGIGIVTVVGAAGVTVTCFGGAKTAGRYACLGLRKVSANNWRITGGVA